VRRRTGKLQNETRKEKMHSHHIIKCNVGPATFLHSARQEIHPELMLSFIITLFSVK